MVRTTHVPKKVIPSSPDTLLPHPEGLKKTETGSKTLKISLTASSLLQDRHATLNSSSP